MTGFVLLHENHRGKFSAFLGIDGGLLRPIAQGIKLDNDLFDRDPFLSESIKLRLRAALPFLKSLGQVVFVGADFA